VEFDTHMLSWRAGRRDSDGVWAKYWYAEVERSTSFGRDRGQMTQVPRSLREMHMRSRAIYDELYKHRLR